MVLQNPIYIDQNAIHRASQMRTLVYAATEGREGVFNATHLAVKAKQTPDSTIQVMPGAWVLRAKHTGGEYESYIGKLSVAETSLPISPTSSSGPRTDLVILRVENPYTVGDGVWATPVDAQEGPYAHIRVIENVPANINHVIAWNSTWSAIPLARITRPANTGIVQQSHILDLRSIAKIGEERLIVIENPPYEPPPIADVQFIESTACDNGDQILHTTGGWTNWPAQASWDVPVPDWAIGFEIHAYLNPEIRGNLVGELRPVINNVDAGITNDTAGIVAAGFDERYSWLNALLGVNDKFRQTYMLGGTGVLNPAHRGKLVNVRLQAHSLSSASPFSGWLKASSGTKVNVTIVFKRYPITPDSED